MSSLDLLNGCRSHAIRLGAVGVSSLTEWTEVLDLSSRWGFPHLRSAAIAALEPLASPVDKLVLCGTYGFSDWIAGALAKLIERQEDLDEEEVERLTSRDIVAIAKGRRQAVLRLLGNQSRVASAPAPHIDTQNTEETIAQINALIDQLRNDASRRVARMSLLEYLQSDTGRVGVALDLILQRGWADFAERNAEDPAADVVWWVRELAELHKRNPSLQLALSWQTVQAALRLVYEWDALSAINLATDGFMQDKSWKTLIRQTKFIAHLCGQPVAHKYTVLYSNVFSSLGTKMSSLLNGAAWPYKRSVARILRALLNEGQTINLQSMFSSTVINMFFTAVEDTRDEALDRQNSDTAAALEVGDWLRILPLVLTVF
jgi:hypothetical protein